jgi:hypothetical protein
MPRHRFDPLSFALGLVAIGVAIAVVAGRVLDADRPTAGAWLAAGGLVLGLGLIPWSQTRRPTSDGEAAGAADDAEPQADVSAEPTAGSA